MILSHTGGGNKSFVEGEIIFAVMVQVDSHRVIERDDRMRGSVDNLGFGKWGHGEHCNSTRSGHERISVKPLLEGRGKFEVWPGRRFHILHGCSPVSTGSERSCSIADTVCQGPSCVCNMFVK